jgi:hypothetical protein
MPSRARWWTRVNWCSRSSTPRACASRRWPYDAGLAADVGPPRWWRAKRDAAPLRRRGRSAARAGLPLRFAPKARRCWRWPSASRCRVFVQTQGQVKGIAVPVAALVRNAANQTIVWVKAAPERFEPRVAVTVEPLDGTRGGRDLGSASRRPRSATRRHADQPGPLGGACSSGCSMQQPAQPAAGAHRRAVLMAYGAFTLSRTPVDVFPDLNKPTVTLHDRGGRHGPEEVEQLITFPLETAMNGLPGVESVRSVSAPACPSSTSPSTGAPTSSARGRWCRNACRAMEERPARRRGAAHGPDQLDHGRDHADRHPDRPRRSAHGRARVRRLGAAPAADGDPRRRPGDPIGGEVRQFQVQPDTARMAELGVTHEQLEGALRATRPTPRAASWS